MSRDELVRVRVGVGVGVGVRVRVRVRVSMRRDELCEARLTRVSSRTRPAWGPLLVWGSRPA